MIFLAVFVVHRAVSETRDIHVEEKHAHPDPRLVERAWKDHRLEAWSASLVIWIMMINIMSWSGSHAISQRPPFEDDMLWNLSSLCHLRCSLLLPTNAYCLVSSFHAWRRRPYHSVI